MADQVTAQVVLRSADGSSILDAKEPITAKTIAKYRPAPKVIEKVAKRLGETGLKVHDHDPGASTLTITCAKTKFEDVFHTKLVERKAEGEGIPKGTVYYEATEPIHVPPEISSDVAGVILPTPPVFFP